MSGGRGCDEAASARLLVMLRLCAKGREVSRSLLGRTAEEKNGREITKLRFDDNFLSPSSCVARFFKSNLYLLR
jgi:hypothetical protein